MKTVGAFTTGAVLPSGRFVVTEWSGEQGINLGQAEIPSAEAAKLDQGNYHIVRAEWGAHGSEPCRDDTEVNLLVTRDEPDTQFVEMCRPIRPRRPLE